MVAEIKLTILRSRMIASKKGDLLTGNEQSICRSELGKLMRIARIARPGAIYDATSAAHIPDALAKPECPNMHGYREFTKKGVRIRLIF